MESSLRADAGCQPDIRTDADFRLIETFGFHPGEGFRRLDRHLARMHRSAQAFGIPFDQDAARAVLEPVERDAPLRCRLTLDAAGGFHLTTAPLGATPSAWVVELATERLSSQDLWLGHKTTRRALYDRSRANLPEGVDELLFLNEREELCEGTITNLFVTLASGECVTPPLGAGVLPGILREVLLETGEVVEKTVTTDDLMSARSISVGNSLRGQIKAALKQA
jgi:4-amino-4-deoxychorismate lyase